MPFAFMIILICQLIGEIISRTLNLSLPGPVWGMITLLIAFHFYTPLQKKIRPLTDGILSHLSLLFVPAGVGIIGHFNVLGGQGLGLVVALIGSTVLTITVTAYVFVGVAKLLNNNPSFEDLK